jgi:signal peptidase I
VDKKEKKKKEEHKETPSESISSFAATFVSGLFIITFIIQLFNIPSASMEKTLLVGDYVFVDRLTPAAKARYTGPLLPYRDVRHGDIVVFLKPSQPGLHLVKRVIGLPGDRIHLRNGVVYRNGQKLDEPYAIHNPQDQQPARDDFPAYPLMGEDSTAPTWPLEIRQYIHGDDLFVPEGYYFMMGDNRDSSLDSRYWGFVPRANIVGRPLFVFWSLDAPSNSNPDQTLRERGDYIFYALRHFFDKTRWRRSFHLVR